MNPHALLLEVRRRYAALRTYADRGWVREEGKEPEVEVAFTTLLDRPRFRFEFELSFPETLCLVEYDGSNAWLTHGRGRKLEKDFGLAVAGATGISHCAALHVPSLLFPEITSTFSHIVGVAILGKATVDGFECLRVAADYEGGYDCELAIDPKELLVRAIRHSLTDTTFVEEHFDVRADERIDPSRFDG